MNRLAILAAVVLLAPPAIHADDEADAEAKIREYFDLFNGRDVQEIIRTIYAVPVHIANQSGHRIYLTGHDAEINLENLYQQISAQGWVESVIQQVDACAIADGLVFAEVRYTRNKANGEAIAPGLRTNIYVVQKLPHGWRIVAFYGKNPDRKMSCNR